MNSSLMKSFESCVNAVTPPHITQLENLGVNRNNFHSVLGGLGIARIDVITPHTFQFNEDGKEAFIIPVCYDYDYCGCQDTLVDLIAFFLDQPRKFFTLLNNEPILNPAAIDKAQIFMGPDDFLHIHSSPLTWLQGNRIGIVILEWSPRLQFYLASIKQIQCETDSLASKLHRELTTPPIKLPEIRIGALKNVI
jgi:hypothetical protein